VAAAIVATGAPAVDVSSGVEAAPGRKDPALIRRFVAAARQASAGDAAPAPVFGSPLNLHAPSALGS